MTTDRQAQKKRLNHADEQFTETVEVKRGRDRLVAPLARAPGAEPMKLAPHCA